MTSKIKNKEVPSEQPSLKKFKITTQRVCRSSSYKCFFPSCANNSNNKMVKFHYNIKFKDAKIFLIVKNHHMKKETLRDFK